MANEPGWVVCVADLIPHTPFEALRKNIKN